MKKITSIIALALLVMACGGNETPADETEATVEEQVSEETIEEVAEVEVIEETVLYPEGTLDPATVTADEVVSAGELSAAYFAWEEREVTIAGYPSIWYGDSIAVEDELGIVMDPEGDDDLVVANFDESLEQYVHRGEIIAIRGTVEENWSGPELNSAVFVEAPESLDALEMSPWIYEEQAIPADQFIELFNVWNGKEVTVEGYYSSTTTSTLDDGNVYRVDLGANDDHYNKAAACEMAEEIPADVAEAMSANREMVQIRGTISGERFGAVGLENCVIINR